MCPVMTGGQRVTKKAAPADERFFDFGLRPGQDLNL
jgi:hypothetical protein